MQPDKKDLKDAISMIDSLIKENHFNYDYWQKVKEKYKKRLEELENV